MPPQASTDFLPRHLSSCTDEREAGGMRQEEREEEGEISVVGQRQVIVTSFNSPTERNNKNNTWTFFFSFLFFLIFIWELFEVYFPLVNRNPHPPTPSFFSPSFCLFFLSQFEVISEVRNGVCLSQFWCCQSQVCFSMMQCFLYFSVSWSLSLLCFCLDFFFFRLVLWSISTCYFTS